MRHTWQTHENYRWSIAAEELQHQHPAGASHQCHCPWVLHAALRYCLEHIYFAVLLILTLVDELGDGERVAVDMIAVSTVMAGRPRVRRVVWRFLRHKWTVRFARLLRFVFVLFWGHLNCEKPSHVNATACVNMERPATSTSWLKFTSVPLYRKPWNTAHWLLAVDLRETRLDKYLIQRMIVFASMSISIIYFNHFK